jgi:hypothetical protein
MLHILRHYRPESVWLFLTPEIRQLAAGDERLEKTRAWITEHWKNYNPTFQFVNGCVHNAHDIDELDRPLTDAMAQLSRENPDAEILINVSSGTPQMQMILSQLAMDMRYRTKGIQVSNFEKASGRAQRTNDKEYDIELELECNEDELPGAENRCVEPEMYAVRREYLRRQITALLDERNFDAVEELMDSLPENLGKLAAHLAARSRLQGGEARRLAGDMKDLPFKLYAYKAGDRTKYNEVVEYYLRMRNLVLTGHYAEFVLNLEPLTLMLQLAALDMQLLLRRTGAQTADFIVEYRNHKYFDPSLLQNRVPELYRHFERAMQAKGWAIEKRDISTAACDILLDYYAEDVPETDRQLFAHYAGMKELRNQLAHTLHGITEADIKAACGVSAPKLLREIEGTIIHCYSACDPVIFSVYDKCIGFIKSNL